MDGLTALLGAAIAAITSLQGWRIANRTRSSETVKAVLQAVNATDAYLSQWRTGVRDPSREAELAGMWGDAAVSIRWHDVALAHKLEIKAQYWCNGATWTPDEVDRAGIAIRDIRERARALLGGEI